MFRVRKGFLLFFLFIVVISCDLESTKSIDKSKHFGKMKSVKRVETIDKVKHFARVGRFDNVEHFDKVKQDIESSVSFVELSANGKVDVLDWNLPLVKLLSEFGMSSGDKEFIKFILHLESIMTSPNIEISEYNETYTKDEFYNLLKNLGADNIRKLSVFIEVWKAYNEMISYFRVVNPKIKFDDVLFELKSNFCVAVFSYFQFLKRSFNEFVVVKDKDKVFSPNLIVAYIYELSSVSVEILYMRAFDRCYDKLCEDDRDAILCVRDLLLQDMLMDPSVFNFKDYKIYDDYEFYRILGKLGADRMVKVAGIFADLNKKMDLLFDSINAFDGYIAAEKDDKRKENFRNAKSEFLYSFHRDVKLVYFFNIKSVFNSDDIDDIYSSIMKLSTSFSTYMEGLEDRIWYFLKDMGIV
ncbi:BTA121 domain-containing protein surface lipoprotein [Borrelia duttonii]|uniref:BTA121 domain-containing protein surface lipoprotein n=1 Tax=Borrelia duttonii TaxID=40834 RepID=UPI0002E5EAFC